MEISFNEWKLRSWTDADKGALVKYANNRKIWTNMQDIFPHPYTLKDAQNWIKRAKKLPDTEFAICSATEVIGGIGLHLMEDICRRSAEIGYWLGEPYWGKGIATGAVKEIVNYAFSNFDLVRLHAFVFEWNPASARVLEKSGFKLEARLAKSVTKEGQTVDCFLYALVRDET